MASAPIPLTNVGSGYTIVTQLIPSSSSSPTTVQQNSSPTVSPLQKFLKGEPKALGTVQIMIGVLTILFGIVLMVDPQTIGVFSGVVFWGSLLHISAGSLAVSSSNKLNTCVVKGAMVLNIFSTIAAGIAIIMLSVDLVIGPLSGYCYYRLYSSYERGDGCSRIAMNRTNGITGVLLVFTLLQFMISIAVAAFTCKATCTNEPTLNIINVVPNSDGLVPVGSSFPAYQPQLDVSTLNTVPMNNAAEHPPAYCEKNPPEHTGF